MAFRGAEPSGHVAEQGPATSGVRPVSRWVREARVREPGAPARCLPGFSSLLPWLVSETVGSHFSD